MNVTPFSRTNLARASAILASFAVLTSTSACSVVPDFLNSESESTTAETASQSDSPAADPSAGQTNSGRKPNPTTAQASPTESTTESTAPASNCGVDTSAEEIYQNISEVPLGEVSGMHWEYNGDSNYDPCADLSYASVDQMPQGNGQFARQLMLFHKGEYLGVGSDRSLQHISVHNISDDSLTVTYKDWWAQRAAGAPNAESGNYTKDVTYHWDGDQVQMIGNVPGE